MFLLKICLGSSSWQLTKTCFTYLSVGRHREDFEHKLIYDLFQTGYSKEALPVMNKSEAIEIMFDMAYSQLIYLVRKLRLGGCFRILLEGGKRRTCTVHPRLNECGANF